MLPRLESGINFDEAASRPILFRTNSTREYMSDLLDTHTSLNNSDAMRTAHVILCINELDQHIQVVVATCRACQRQCLANTDFVTWLENISCSKWHANLVKPFTPIPKRTFKLGKFTTTRGNAKEIKLFGPPP